MSAAPRRTASRWRWRPPAAAIAILFAALVGGALVLASGANPLDAYAEIVHRRAVAWDNLPNTLNWATPLVGMTLVAAIPLRGGMVNLGGDGQLVIGAWSRAIVAALSCRGPARSSPPLALAGRGARRRPLRRARRLGRDAPWRADADLEPAA